MPRQPEIHFRLKPKDKNGNCTIYMQFIYRGRRLFYSFGETVRPEDWDKGKQVIKKKNATTQNGKFAINDLLANLKKICEKTYNESLKNGTPEPEVLKDAMDRFINQNHNEIGKPTLFDLADRFIAGEIKHRGKDKSVSSLKNYAAVTKHLKEFDKHLNFESVTLDFFYKYVSFLEKKKGLAINTVAKDISILKVFMGEAVDLGYTTNMQFKHKKFAYGEVETENIYLTEVELHSLYNFKIPNSKLEQVKDLFIFGAWTGLRISDFNKVKPENIVNIDGDYFIKTVTQKTKEPVIIPCNPVVLDIFNKYSHNANRLPKSISGQKFNDYIKQACKLAGLTETGRLISQPDAILGDKVSSHTARRSFATNYYLQGFPAIDLMKITGHKTEKAFMKYIKVSKLDTAKRLSAHIKKNWSEKILRVA